MRRDTTLDPSSGPREGIFSDPDFRLPDGGTAVAVPGAPAEGRSPFDEELHQMSDDGCPLVPDPAPRSDPDWRDNLGEWDTFADEVRMGFPTASRHAVQTQQAPGHQSLATDRRAAPLVCPTAGRVSRRRSGTFRSSVWRRTAMDYGSRGTSR